MRATLDPRTCRRRPSRGGGLPSPARRTEVGQGTHPLTAPAVNPATTNLRKTSTRIAMGAVTDTAAAKIVP
ncbi:hypothetical protein GCM10027294_45070 [Marinactinospora endophytica]